MARVKRSVHAKKKRREILEKAKGYTGSRNTRYRVAKEQVMHSGNYAYRTAGIARRSSAGYGSPASTLASVRTASRTRDSSTGSRPPASRSIARSSRIWR
jgi:hypothetical protein